MAVNSAASAEADSLERLRQADGAGSAHAEALAEDAIIWASLNGLVRLHDEQQSRPTLCNILHHRVTH